MSFFPVRVSINGEERIIQNEYEFDKVSHGVDIKILEKDYRPDKIVAKISSYYDPYATPMTNSEGKMFQAELDVCINKRNINIRCSPRNDTTIREINLTNAKKDLEVILGLLKGSIPVPEIEVKQ